MRRGNRFRRHAPGWNIIGWGLAAAMCLPAGAARADFTVCNPTPNRVALAIGYHDERDWVSEGWWNLAGNACETVLTGDLTGRFYYVHAIDYDGGGSWGGDAPLCTAVREFTIRGRTGCEARGYRRTGFYEVDTGEAQDWVLKLSDPRDKAADNRSGN